MQYWPNTFPSVPVTPNYTVMTTFMKIEHCRTRHIVPKITSPIESTTTDLAFMRLVHIACHGKVHRISIRSGNEVSLVSIYSSQLPTTMFVKFGKIIR
ncbi:hypothetical protein IMSAG192_00136 [Muribaculaceae bacterium]|nr:hypothetical protein IMSAG192_00136 [Muribaculaceae bacterium]